MPCTIDRHRTLHARGHAAPLRDYTFVIGDMGARHLRLHIFPEHAVALIFITALAVEDIQRIFRIAMLRATTGRIARSRSDIPTRFRLFPEHVVADIDFLRDAIDSTFPFAEAPVVIITIGRKIANMDAGLARIRRAGFYNGGGTQDLGRGALFLHRRRASAIFNAPYSAIIVIAIIYSSISYSDCRFKYPEAFY